MKLIITIYSYMVKILDLSKMYFCNYLGSLNWIVGQYQLAFDNKKEFMCFVY
ncbi:MAG: hypothetical protein ACI9EK_003030 [Psychroserpens sp.]|jgi:hypothetical protein